MYYCCGTLAKIIALNGGLKALADRLVRIDVDAPYVWPLVIEHRGNGLLDPDAALVAVSFLRGLDGVEVALSEMILEVDPTDHSRRGWQTGAWKPIEIRYPYGGYRTDSLYEFADGKIVSEPEDYELSEMRSNARLRNKWARDFGYLEVAEKVAARLRAEQELERAKAAQKRGRPTRRVA